jgi:CRISPR-associated protein Csd1
MLVEQLKVYAEERMKPQPTLYSEAPVRYLIDLDSKGHLLISAPIDTADPTNRRTRRGTPRLVPQIQRAASVKPLLLVDKADYVFGVARPSDSPLTDVQRRKKEQRVAACNDAYLDLVDRCFRATGEPTVGAVLTFLRNDPLAHLNLADSVDLGALICFRVDGIFPTDLPSVQAFWATEHAPSEAPDSSSPTMQCATCGEQRPVLERLQAKIKGVPGGQTSGTALISANAPAFESYGLHSSLISPTCARCGEYFTLALNELLAKESNRLYLGGTVMVCWTRRDVGFDFFDAISEPSLEQVRALIDARFKPRSALPEVDETAFYSVNLSGSGGRTVVRDWIDTTVGNAKRQMGAWFARQGIVGEYGEAPRPLGIYALAAATARELKDVPPTIPRIFLRSVLLDTPLPWNLLAETIRRCHAEQRVTRQQATLIKLVLKSHEPVREEDDMIQLNTDHPSAAYQCGRALAVLERAQRLAIPGIKATVVDRFYGTASTAPTSVFPRLLSGSKPHLAKLERDRPAAYHALQNRLEEILSHLAGFPAALTLQDQGLFALGYYHQRASDRAQARAAAERRQSGPAEAAPSAVDNANLMLEHELGPNEIETGKGTTDGR